MTGPAKARRPAMGRARKVRMAKGIVVSVLAHILVCAILGFAAARIRLAEPSEPVYDVALIGAPAPAPVPAPASSAPAPPPEPLPEKEETPPPEPDDIIEEKKPEETPPEPVPEPMPEPTPQPPVPTPLAPASAPASAEAAGTPGGQGAASGDAAGTNPEGTGSGEAQGIPPASDAIEAPAVPPSVVSSRAPEYPYAAQSRGIEGTVVIRFLLDKEGEVEDFEIVESSGNNALDTAAMRAAEGFSFSPGLDGYGRPVRCYAYQPFTFRLQ